MISSIKKIPIGARAAVVYTLANVFSRGLAIITMPIFTRLMSTDQIGIVNLYNSWFSIFSIITTLSLTSGGFSVAMKEFEDKRKEYTSSVLTLTTFFGLIFISVYVFNPQFWSNITGMNQKLMVLLMFGIVFTPATDFWLAYERYEYRYKATACLIVVSSLVASLLSIIVVIYQNKIGVDSLVEARLFANGIVIYGIACGQWIYIMLKGKKYISFKYWRFSLSLSLPLVGYSIASQILGVADRMMIGYMVNNSAVGIYSTVYSVSTLFTMVWTAINASFVPYLYQNIEKNKEQIKKLSFSLLLVYAIAAIVMVLFAPEIIKILATNEYLEAIYIMPPIAAGVFMTSVANMYSNILLFLKSSKYIMFAAAIAAIVNVVLNYIFIPRFGYMVAAYTTMISYLIMLLFLICLSKKEYEKKAGEKLDKIYDNSKFLRLTIFVIVFMLFGILLYRINIIRYFLGLIMIFICLKLCIDALKKNSK